MSSKNNRILLSTCASIIAISAVAGITNTAQAGFEWAPPEKVEVEATKQMAPAIPEAPAILEVPEAIVQQPVIQETLDTPTAEIQDVIESADVEPAIEIKVLDEKVLADIEEMEKEIAEEQSQPIAPVALDENFKEEITDVVSVAADDHVVVVTTDETSEKIELHHHHEENEAPISKPLPIETANINLKETQDNAVDTEIISRPIEDVETPRIAVDQAQAVTAENDISTALNIESSEASDQHAEEVASLKIDPYPLDNPNNLDDISKDDIKWNKTTQGNIIEGFGKDMPLALALRQIVPPHYAFSFGKGVNPGTLISWEGGRAWNKTLQDALAKIDVAFTTQDHTLSLRTVTSAAPNAIIDDTKIAKVIEKDVQEQAITPIVEDAVTDTEEQAIENLDAVVKEVEPISTATHEELQDAIEAPAEEELTEIKEAEVAEIVEETEASSLIEELLQPLDADKAVEEEVKETVVERKNILDPGQIQTEQPNEIPAEAVKTADDVVNEVIEAAKVVKEKPKKKPFQFNN